MATRSFKYYPRLGIYKNTTGTVTFNPITKEAYSYSWWRFAEVINGKFVFNNYSYSITTTGHQSVVRSLFYKLNIKIDLFIDAPQGLGDLQRALDWNKEQLPEYEGNAKRARKEWSKNHWQGKANSARKAIEFITDILPRKAA